MTDTPIAEMVPNVTPNAWSRDYPDAACPRCPKCSTLLGIRWAQFSESGDDRWACDGCGRTFRSVPFTPTGATHAEVEALRAERDDALKLQGEVHRLRTGIKLLADTVRAWGWQSKVQESNGELVGRALHDIRARVAELEGALAPFAAMAEHYPQTRTYGNRPSFGSIYQVATHGKPDAEITVEGLHAARAALSPATEG